MLDDAEALAQGLIHRGIADQQGGLGVEHAVAHGGADAEPLALGGLCDELAFLERHQYSPARADGFGGQAEDHREQLGQRAAGGQFPSGSEQRRDGAAPLRRQGGLVLVLALALEKALERDADCLFGGTAGGGQFEEHGLVSVGLGGIVHQHSSAGDDAIAGIQPDFPGHAGAVEERAVLAAQIAESPLIAIAFDGHVLARKADVIGKAEFVGAGAAEREALSLQARLGGYAVRRGYGKFARHSGLSWTGRGPILLTVSSRNTPQGAGGFEDKGQRGPLVRGRRFEAIQRGVSRRLRHISG